MEINLDEKTYQLKIQIEKLIARKYLSEIFLKISGSVFLNIKGRMFGQKTILMI